MRHFFRYDTELAEHIANMRKRRVAGNLRCNRELPRNQHCHTCTATTRAPHLRQHLSFVALHAATTNIDDECEAFAIMCRNSWCCSIKARISYWQNIDCAHFRAG